MNKLQIIIVCAGLFQIFSQASDQYVIQKEQVIRKVENEITQKQELMEENVNSNISYGTVYQQIAKDTFLKLRLNNSKFDDNLLREHLKRNKNIMYNNFKILMTNSSLQVDDPEKFIQPFKKIEVLLNSKKNIMSIKDELISNFTPGTGLMLNELYAQNKKLETSISDLNDKHKNNIRNKYFILITGMICNIISIFFVLLFFLSILVTKKNKKIKISFFKN